MIGSPIAHSISPAIHNAAFTATGIDARYEAAHVLPEELGDWVKSARGRDCLGFNVTLPHKIAIRDYIDRVEGDAVAAGAVNTVVVEQQGTGALLVGANTDTVGFRRLLASEAGLSLAGKRVLLLGAGGGARAVAVVAAQDGARALAIANRHVERAEDLKRGVAGLSKEMEVTIAELDHARELLAEADVVVNATSVGLASEEVPLDPAAMRPDSVAVDLIYNPRVTMFLRLAAQRGAATVGGLGMLVHQAAAAFERWTGTDAPVAVMRDAAERALQQ